MRPTFTMSEHVLDVCYSYFNWQFFCYSYDGAFLSSIVRNPFCVRRDRLPLSERRWKVTITYFPYTYVTIVKTCSWNFWEALFTIPYHFCTSVDWIFWRNLTSKPELWRALSHKGAWLSCLVRNPYIELRGCSHCRSAWVRSWEFHIA